MAATLTRLPRLAVAALLLVALLVPSARMAAQSSSRLKPTHHESGAIGRTSATKLQELTAFCLDRQGNILACDGKAGAIKAISPADRLVSTWRPGFAPQAIACGSDGCIYVGGGGALVKLDARGKPVVRRHGTPFTDEIASIGVGDRDVFVAGRSNLGYAVFRLTKDLTEPHKIVDGLSGCCGQMDIAWRDGTLWVAENGRKRMVAYSRSGKELQSWTKDGDEVLVANFSGCCNPKNLFHGPDNRILTSESEIGRVKAYTHSGELVQVLGNVKAQQGCVRVTVACNADASKVYVLDGDAMVIRILAGPGEKSWAAARSRSHAPGRVAAG